MSRIQWLRAFSIKSGCRTRGHFDGRRIPQRKNEEIWRSFPQPHERMTPRKAAFIAGVGQWFIRAILCTLRFRIVDRAGILAQPPILPGLWVFWHNRLFVVPYIFERFVRARPGAALTSASKDGELLAAILAR